MIEENRFLSLTWALIFFPVSLIWLLGCHIKYLTTKKRFIDIPVISIGNLEAGGTGKTPLTVEIGKILKKFFSKIYVVCYERNQKTKDEGLVIANKLSEIRVVSGKNRKKLFWQLIKDKPELVIIDDGFQYFEINNKIDIVILDPETKTDFLIPAGRMRFPISFLKYADIIIVKKGLNKKKHYKKFLEKLDRFGKPIFTAKYIPLYLADVSGAKVPLSVIENKRILALCGIAKPSSFITMLKDFHPLEIYAAVYPDHFSYTQIDVQEIEKIFKTLNLDLLITTTKDFVKLKKFELKVPVVSLEIKFEIEQQEKFKKLMLDKLQLK